MLSVPDMEVGVQLSEEQQAVLKLVERGEVSFDLSRSLPSSVSTLLRRPPSAPRC